MDGRGKAVVFRLAILLALLSKSTVIRPKHLEGALAIWKHHQATVRHMWPTPVTGDRDADRLLLLLTDRWQPRADLRQRLGIPARRFDAIAGQLLSDDLLGVKRRRVSTAGRTREEYRRERPTES